MCRGENDEERFECHELHEWKPKLEDYINSKKMTQFYYTYYSYEEFGRGYIGKRSCKCSPEEDVKYFGSYRDKTFKPTQKIILETYDTVEEALADEIKVQRFFKVVENSHFANQAYQSSNKFSYVMPSEKARSNMIRINQNRTPEQRKQISSKGGKARMASMTPEQRSELVRKSNANRTREQRSETAKKGYANKTPEQRSELTRKKSDASKKAQANRTPEQRSESTRKGHASRTPEQRSEIGRKASSQKFQCTVTDYITNAGGLSHYQRARGIDTSNRVRVS
jgi:general stress protein YciG